MSFDVEEFHADAVRTPSHEDVSEMRGLLRETLRDAGVDSRIDEFGNVLASRGPGAEGGGEANENGDTDGPHVVLNTHVDTDGPHVVLNTHVDTVAPHVPYERDGDVVRGRGACDAKGPLAALLAAFLRVEPAAGTLTLAITPDEETLMTGAEGLADRLSADCYVVGEPTGLDVCVAARGQCEATITVTGEEGHAASVPAERNPAFGVANVLEALRTFDEEAGTGEDPVLGEPKLTPTVLSGGEAPNRVPARCRITVDRRSVPPETSETFRAALADYLAGRIPHELSVSVELVRPDTPFPPAFATDESEAVVQALQEASGGEVRPFGAATEAGFFAADAPTVVFGPGVLADEEGAVAHAEREYVRIEEVHRAADAVEAAVRRLST